MCFSAGASFGASAVLGVIGIASLIRSKKPSQKLFASVPLIFSVQQFAEGVVWLSLHNNDHMWLQQMSTYTYLIFAQVLWPIWVPLSIMSLEADRIRKRGMLVMFAMGVIVATYNGYCMAFYNVQAEIVSHHINYRLDFPSALGWASFIFYFTAAIIPPLISSIKRVQVFGLIIFVSYIVARIFFVKYLLSVWCFFAAIISILVFSIIEQLRKENAG